MFNFIFKIERWKYNKTYQVWVSNQGRFRNKSKVDIPVKISNDGYCYIKVDCSTCQFMRAHRLVMLTWKPTSEAENLTVDHLDHNKRNNALSNLEWVSRTENLERAKDDYIQVISKEAFDKLVEAEIQKRLPEIPTNSTITSYENDIVVYIGKDKTPIMLGTFIDAIYDTLEPHCRVKLGDTKPKIHEKIKQKIQVCKKQKMNYCKLGNRKIYFI